MLLTVGGAKNMISLFFKSVYMPFGRVFEINENDLQGSRRNKCCPRA